MADITKVTEIYGSLVFDSDTMKERLPKDVFKAVQKTARMGSHLERSLADIVAAAMKEWAVSHGARLSKRRTSWQDSVLMTQVSHHY